MRAFVERQVWCPRVFHPNFVQRGIAARAELRATLRLNAGLLLEFQQRIIRRGACLPHERFQFARIEPQPATALAEIDFNILEMEDKERDIAFWTDAYHGKTSARG